MPGGCKSAEVVQTNRVHVKQQGANPINRPAVAGCAQCIPVVNRIAPQLSLRTEVVRRNPRYKSRPAVLIEQEQFRIRPHITRIRRDKEGQIADQPDALRMRISLKLISLAEEQELCERHLLDFV